MGLRITIQEYFGPYYDNEAADLLMQTNAVGLLDKVNAVYELAHADGCELPDNPKTKSGVSGEGHGGFRAPECTVGAPDSTHRKAQGVDRYDLSRKFAAWCLDHEDVLRQYGLYMEDPRWTPTWVHLQCVPPHSMHTVYIPSSAPAMAGLPPDWSTFA